MRMIPAFLAEDRPPMEHPVESINQQQNRFVAFVGTDTRVQIPLMAADMSFGNEPAETGPPPRMVEGKIEP